MTWTADGRRLIADSGGKLAIWDSSERKKQDVLDVGISTAVYTYVSPDGRYVATACPGLTLVDLSEKKVVKNLAPDMVQRAVFTPDSKVVLAPLGSGELVAWSTADGSEQSRLKLSESSLVWAAVSPSGRLAAVTDVLGNLYLVELPRFRLPGAGNLEPSVRARNAPQVVRTIQLEAPGREDSAYLVAFTKDRSFLTAVSLSGGRVRVFGRGR